jgi:ribosomal protein S18 acetylase RimI-like enzyme
MEKFHLAISDGAIASQIAEMLNNYNKWARRFYAGYILNSKANYFVELNGSTVVGCAAYTAEYPTLSQVHHICVLPPYRKRGVARRLTDLAIANCGTDYVYMTVREDNGASLALARSMGFVYVNKRWFRDHWTLILGRRRINVNQKQHM